MTPLERHVWQPFADFLVGIAFAYDRFRCWLDPDSVVCRFPRLTDSEEER